MSYTSIFQSTVDESLLRRLRSAIAKEAFNNTTFRHTVAGQAVVMSGPSAIVARLIWPLCIDNEAAYAYAIDTGNPDPGGAPGVITDANIGAAVQAHWPPDPAPPVPQYL